jgi:hypothetical protein
VVVHSLVNRGMYGEPRWKSNFYIPVPTPSLRPCRTVPKPCFPNPLTPPCALQQSNFRTGNNTVPWSSYMWCICIVKQWLCIIVWRLYELLLIYVLLCEDYMYCYINLLYDLFWRLSIRGQTKQGLYKKSISFSVNRGTYGLIFLS